MVRECRGLCSQWGTNPAEFEKRKKTEGKKKQKQEIKIPIKEFFYMCWGTLMTERCLGSAVFRDRMKEAVKQKTCQLHELYPLPAFLLHMHIIFVSRCTTDAF